MVGAWFASLVDDPTSPPSYLIENLVVCDAFGFGHWRVNVPREGEETSVPRLCLTFL